MIEPSFKLPDLYKSRLDEAAAAISTIPEGSREASLENINAFFDGGRLKLAKDFDGPAIGTSDGTISLEITFWIDELIAPASIAGKF